MVGKIAPLGVITISQGMMHGSSLNIIIYGSYLKLYFRWGIVSFLAVLCSPNCEGIHDASLFVVVRFRSISFTE